MTVRSERSKGPVPLQGAQQSTHSETRDVALGCQGPAPSPPVDVDSVSLDTEICNCIRFCYLPGIWSKTEFEFA